MTESKAENPYSEIWAIAWPVIAYTLLQALVQFVDTWMVGRLGPEAIAAVGMSRQIIMFLMILIMAVSTGTSTMTAQAYGAQNRGMVCAVMAQSLLMGIVMSLVLGGVGYASSGWMLNAMGAPPHVFRQGLPYMRILFAGITLMVLGFVISAGFRGAGDTKTPLAIAVVVNVINVPANYVFIFGAGIVPPFGVAGAAIGTVIARGVGLMLALACLLSGRFRVTIHPREINLDPGLMRRILRIGLPSAGQGAVRNGARMVFFRLVATSAIKSAALAAYVIGLQFRFVSIMLGLAFQTAASSVVGQRIGAQRYDEAERAAWAAAKLSALFLGAFALVCVIFAWPLVGLFVHGGRAGNTDAAQVASIAAMVLRLFAVSAGFAGVGIALSGALAGAGDTPPGFWYTVYSQWLFMLPVVCILMWFAKLDPQGAWIGLAAADVLQWGMYVRRVRSGAWKLRKL